MAYSFQTFTFKAVLTSAEMNQVEINIRDHVHGTAGVVTVPDTGLSSNVALKNISNSFTVNQTIVKSSSAALLLSGTSIDAATRNWAISSNFIAFGDLVFRQSSLRGGDPIAAGVNHLYIAANGDIDTIGNITQDLTIKKTSSSVIIDATTGTGNVIFKHAGVQALNIGSPSINILRFFDNTVTAKIEWDLSTGTLTLGNIPDARLTSNVALKNIDNSFTVGQRITGDVNTASSGGLSLKYGKFTSTPTNSTDSWIGVQDTGGPGGLSGDLIMGPRSSTGVASAIRMFTGQTTIGERLVIDTSGLVDIKQQVKIQGGVPGLNKVLTSDAAGLATWEVNPTAPFENNGNASGANRTLGNTDNFSLGFETNNINRLNIAANGDIDTIGNITQDLTIKKTGNAILVLDATTGSGFIEFRQSGALKSAVNSSILDKISFLSGGAVKKVEWDLSGTNGKLTQGDVPLARLDATAANAGYPQSGTGGETLRVIRGRIGSSGLVDAGSGFTVSRIAAGIYTITFTTAFGSEASVSGTCFGSNNLFIQTISASQVEVRTVALSTNTLIDSTFDFTAIGPS